MKNLWKVIKCWNFASTDDGKGHKEIYRVQDFDLIPLDEDYYGMFFGGDSYVIKYTYEKDSRQGYIIYFWQVKSLVIFHIYKIKNIEFR